jgi:LssY C-terminus
MSRRITSLALFAAAVAAVLSLVRSDTFSPEPSADGAFVSRAESQTAAGLKVSVAALGPEESQRSFGADLARYDIQPVWLSIENDTDETLFYLPVATDPAYYSPYEVAYRFHGMFSRADNDRRNAFFLERQISSILPPHSRTSGFVYTVLDAGMKFVRVEIAGKGREETFSFVARVPGARFLGQDILSHPPYPPERIKGVDLTELRDMLKDQPCCTTNAAGDRKGDPLNLVVVEGNSDAIAAVASRDWHLVQTLDIDSMVETARAFLFHDEYLTSPVSPLYLFGREEDFALQKARSTINERVHLRVWLMPQTFHSRRVWIGQISRDIGVRLTDQAWNLTTHKIGPDVDFDRGYILQDLLLSGLVDHYGYVEGVGAAPMSAPRTNLTGDPYFTDGLRLVLFLSDRKTPIDEVGRLPWATPAQK